MSSKKTPGINSTSTADIAFLLLCYFLMSQWDHSPDCHVVCLLCLLKTSSLRTRR